MWEEVLLQLVFHPTKGNVKYIFCQINSMQGWGLDFRSLVGNYINTMKTTFDLNCNSYQAVTHKHRSHQKLSIKKASL